MFEKSIIGVFIVESPVHCGIGQDVGVVDLPIQRERHTEYPMIQGSEVKGCFRQYYEKKHNKGNSLEEIFGPEESGDDDKKFASAISFGDARILLFPVKSLKGTYVWITSKDVLEKFKRTLKMADKNGIKVPDVECLKDEEILVYDSSVTVDEKVVLEEYMFAKKAGLNGAFNDVVDAIVPNAEEYNYLKGSLKKKICVVSNDIFKEFVTMSTEVVTRIRINNDTGIVDKGALWTEEYIPCDAILYFPVFSSKARKLNSPLNAEDVLTKVKTLHSYIQIGGNETVGKGFVRINWIENNGGEKK